MAKAIKVVRKPAKRVAKYVPLKAQTPGEIRVEIAQDVLAQLKLKKLIPIRGQYFYITDKAFQKVIDKALQNDSGIHVKAKVKSCEACAIGSVFICAFNRFDAASADLFGEDNSGTGTEYINYLSTWFPTYQLRLMEAAFETEIGRGGLDGSLTDRAAAWAEDFKATVLRSLPRRASEKKKAEALLTAVMENVVKNNGTFVPVDPVSLIAEDLGLDSNDP